MESLEKARRISSTGLDDYELLPILNASKDQIITLGPEVWDLLMFLLAHMLFCELGLRFSLDYQGPSLKYKVSAHTQSLFSNN